MRILLSLVFLAVASIYDLRTREVPNRLWIFFLPFSIISTIVYAIANPNQIYLIIASISSTSLIAVLIFYLGLYGGADAKALITLAVTHPTQLTGNFTVLPLLPLSAFNNSLVLMVLMLPLSLLRNLYWKVKNHRSLFQGLEKVGIWKKAAALLLCIKTSRSHLKPYDLLAEKVEMKNGESYRTLKLFQRISEEDTIVDATVPEDVFVIFSLPMLPFLGLGYLGAVTVGDLLLRLIALFLG